MIIDPHVHCRDGLQSYKETIPHVFKLADEQGVSVIFDMPNTDPPILTEADVDARLKLVPAQALDRYRLYLGVTTDENQLRQAAALASARPEIAGLKLYAGRSVGNLAVENEYAQKRIYQILADAAFEGVLAVHCEKLRNPDHNTFDPARPYTHCLERPPESETEAVQDQIAFAVETGFRGTLHIAHVSVPGSVAVVKKARQSIKITCGVTHHHLLWNSTRLKNAEGLIYKTNPPLRDSADNIELRTHLKNGDIDWIESDHAPHALTEKLFPPYLSGFPSIMLYNTLIKEVLPMWGIDANRIRALTCDNIRNTFTERKLP